MDLRLHSGIAGLFALCAAAAQAHGDVRCEPVPKAQWRPDGELRDRLVADGWQVRRIKVENGCYEVYGLDKAGNKVEAFFHPKTLEPAASAPKTK
jgi:hypothetical protein